MLLPPLRDCGRVVLFADAFAKLSRGRHALRVFQHTLFFARCRVSFVVFFWAIGGIDTTVGHARSDRCRSLGGAGCNLIKSYLGNASVWDFQGFMVYFTDVCWSCVVGMYCSIVR